MDIYNCSHVSDTENIPKKDVLEYFKGFMVTKERCCYGYPVTKDKIKWQMDIQRNVILVKTEYLK